MTPTINLYREIKSGSLYVTVKRGERHLAFKLSDGENPYSVSNSFLTDECKLVESYDAND